MSEYYWKRLANANGQELRSLIIIQLIQIHGLHTVSNFVLRLDKELEKR